MPPRTEYRNIGIHIDADSIVGRYAEYHARAMRRPIGAIGSTRQDVSLFVENELLVDSDQPEVAEDLRLRYGAEVIEEREIPPPPSEMKRASTIDPESIPRTTRVRFHTPPRVDAGLQLRERFAHAQRVIASSEMAVALAGIVDRHGDGRGSIGLNFVGQPLAMPLATAKEGQLVSDPYTWLCFNGRIRVVQAWQLIDSIRAVRGDAPVWLAVMDEGFWLDANGVPNVSPFESESDFGPGVLQVNLINEHEGVGGPTGYAYRWHGNAVASIAAGTLNNKAGTAGAAGNTARPVFLRTNIDIYQMMYGAKLCAAWGIDVLNISVGTWDQSEFWFPTSQWNKAFQFAADNGVVMIAAAGNDGLDLPDDRNIRPATRTPGVLTVGALELNEEARGNSNYGSSVGLWAPGTDNARAPDGDNLGGSTGSGTSYAAPMVAGVAAMMRYANPQLSAKDVRMLLVQTGWSGQGHVTKGLDAYAAVLAAIQGVLPDNGEANNTPQTARSLVPVGGGALAPAFGVFTAKASSSDFDYWKFTVNELSTVTATTEWYERLASLTVALDTDDPDAIGADDIVSTSKSGEQTLTGTLSAGTYRIRVGGSGASAYRLVVRMKSAGLARDEFEPNDSFETAARLIFEPRPFPFIQQREWGPGTYDATLHRSLATFVTGAAAINTDFYILEVPEARSALHVPEVSVFDADVPLNVTLYDSERTEIQRWHGRSMSARPPANSICYLKVAADAQSRYRIGTRMTYERGALPGPQQAPFEIIPQWWLNTDPIRILEPEHVLAIEVNMHPGEGDVVAFEHTGDPLTIELLDETGQVIRASRSIDARLSISTAGVAPGTYAMRVRRQGGQRSAAISLSHVPPRW